MIEVQEISNSGPVMQDNNVKVTSALVQHPPVTPALAYRFDFPDRSIAFSGDTHWRLSRRWQKAPMFW